MKNRLLFPGYGRIAATALSGAMLVAIAALNTGSSQGPPCSASQIAELTLAACGMNNDCGKVDIACSHDELQSCGACVPPMMCDEPNHDGAYVGHCFHPNGCIAAGLACQSDKDCCMGLTCDAAMKTCGSPLAAALYGYDIIVQAVYNAAHGSRMTPLAASYGVAYFQEYQGYTCSNSATVNGCYVRHCSGNFSLPAIGKSAGKISVTGASTAFDLTPDMMDTYSLYSSGSLLWTAPVTLNVSWSGADVVAGMGTVMAPANEPTLVSPTLTPGVSGSSPSTTVVRAMDLNFMWTGGRDGDLSVSLVAPGLDAGSGDTLQCRWSGATGSATIPSSTLQMLTAGKNAVMQVRMVNTTAVPTKDRTVTVTATTGVLDPNGELISGAIVTTLQ